MLLARMVFAMLCKQFGELTSQELHDILKLRAAVFVVEQHCFYLDPDDYDQSAVHVCWYEQDALAGYARILPPGTKREEVSIGRFCVASAYRGNGNGGRVFQAALDYAGKAWPEVSVVIEAQAGLQSYYERFGFETVSAPYDEAGIVHIKMLAHP